MRRLLLIAAAGAAACTVGPKYKPETVISPATEIGAPRLSDSSRHFFDSLAVERAREKYVVNCAKRRAEPDGKFLVDVRLHDLRHEGISRLAARGIEVHQLARITGHLTLRMLMRYYNPTDEELVALVD